MTRSTRLLVAAGVTVVLAALTSCSASGEADEAAADAPRVQPAEALERIDDGARIIDVRTPEEFDTGHVEGALNLDIQSDDFMDELDDLDRDDSFVVYCRTGARAATATDHMLDLGFTEVVNAGGFDELEVAGVQAE